MPRSLPSAVTRALRLPRWSTPNARLIIDALVASGLSVPEFSREHRVDAQRLYAWRRRLAAGRRDRAGEAPIAFVQLQPRLQDAAASARYQIRLPTGEALRIHGAIVPDDVAALLAILRGARSC
jgi:transposase-like protein